MERNQYYKNAALAALEGKWAAAVVCAAVMFLLSGVGSVAAFFIVMPLCVGCSFSFYRLYRDGDASLTSNMFKDSFEGYWHNVWGMFLVSVYIALWSLLLVVPGIIKSISYAMTPFILKDNPELSASQAIALSEKMMKGHKMEYFLLQMSFIGWVLLSFLTLGIGLLWLMPYMMAALASFYQNVKNQSVQD